MDFGRIHCFLVATKNGDVVYERYYDAYTELDKAEIRAAFQQAADNVNLAADDQDFVASFKGGCIVLIPENDVVFYCLSSGEYDELATSELLRLIVTALSRTIGKPPTESVIFQNYAKVCLVVDEIINEGMIEETRPEAITKGTKSKGIWE